MPQAETVALPKRLPLVIAPENRDSSTDKDSKLLNGFLERQMDGNWQLYGRPGLLRSTQPSGGAAVGRGVFNWQDNIYSVFGTNLYKNNTSLGTVDGTNGVYRFSLSSGDTPRLVLGNGVAAYTYDNATLAQITDIHFPASFYKGWAYLDKTTYVMSDPNNINGSELDDPTAWDELNLIEAQVEPDTGIGLAKQLVYVIAFKEWNTEVFYDAQNTTGSPLGTVQGAKLNFGCATIESVQDIDGMLLWVATNRNSSPQIILMDNLKPSIISTAPIERLLDGADFSTCYSWIFKEWGHWFYGLTLPNSNLTLVYDMKEKLWAQWTDTNGDYFPMVSATFGELGQHIFQHESNGRIYIASGDYVTDDGDLFTVDIYTPNFDGGTKRRKHMGRLTFVGDQTPGSVWKVRHNDNDYKDGRWSGWRTVNMSQRNPFLSNEGTFISRAYNMQHRCNARARIAAIDLQMDLGTL